MSASMVIERTLPFGRRGRASSEDLHAAERRPPAPLPSPRVPRIARLMALALHIEALVQAGTVPSYAAAARLGHVSRAEPRPLATVPPPLATVPPPRVP